ncbi:putative DNA primase/helicase [Sphingobium faniae]|nr:putative DNA primase/helicase [Sphingobium faniae]
MRAEGVSPDDATAFIGDVTSGEVVRFDCVGERRGSKNGWAKLYLDARPAGAFGNWKQGINRRWSSGAANELSPQERASLRREWDDKKAEREAIRREAQFGAGRDAGHIWGNAEAASPAHPYVQRKRIDPAPLRQTGSDLLIPMFDDEGRLWNVQRILPDGKKLFLKEARIDGLFTIIGSFAGHREAVIGEGYATLDAVHQSTSLPCIVAFNTSNLPKVARIWAARRPDLNFILFADDDEATAQKILAERGIYKNPGIEAAEAVATEIGAKVAYPLGRAA